GRPTPSWNGSVSATLTLWKRLRLFGLVEGLGGNSIVTADAAYAHVYVLQTKAVLEGNDPVLSGYLGNLLLNGDGHTGGATGLFKAGFAKLRTLSATYDLPDRVARFVGAGHGSVTVSGENLAILWWAQRESFGRAWVDPEISEYATSGGGFSAYNQEGFP